MQNVLEMVVLGESAARKITRSLTSQSDHRYGQTIDRRKRGIGNGSSARDDFTLNLFFFRLITHM